MKRKILSASFIFLVYTFSYSQQYSKIYSFDQFSISGYQIPNIDIKITYLAFQSFCDQNLNECSGIIKLDSVGSIIDIIKIQNFDIRRNPSIWLNNHLLLFGKDISDPNINSNLVIYEINPSTLTINNVYNIKDTIYKYGSFFPEQIKLFNGKLLLGGAIKLPEKSISFIYSLNENFEIENTKYIEFENANNSVMSEVFVDIKGNLNGIFYETYPFADQFTTLVTFDHDFNPIWKWREKYTFDHPDHYGCPLKNGNLLLVNQYYGYKDQEKVICINPKDSTVAWIYHWSPESIYNNRIITKIGQINNGNIIGVGLYKDSLNRKFMPFIFCLSESGNLLWERAFGLNNNLSSNHGSFNNFYKLNDELIATGFLEQRLALGQIKRNLFIVKLDSLGCLTEECNTVTFIDNDIINSNVDIVEKSDPTSSLKIYPNPIYDIAKIESETNGLLDLYDLRGTLIKKQEVKQGDNFLDMEACVNGMYMLRFVDEKGKEYNTKIVKVNDD